jgi:Zn-dependent protease
MRFRLFGIPVNVQAFFWIVAVLLGQNSVGEATWVRDMAMWMAVMFTGVLVHELGHAFMGRAFGLVPAIELHGMGGVTSWLNDKRVPATGRVLIAVAGPVVGITIGLAALFVWKGTALVSSPLAAHLARDIVWVNLGWGVLNLIPMLPLDGGHVMTSGLEAVTGNARRSRLWGHALSLLIAVGLGVLVFLYAFSVWNLVLLGLFAWTNFQGLQAVRARA